MEHYRVVRNNEEGLYFIVFKDFVKFGSLTEAFDKEGKHLTNEGYGTFVNYWNSKEEKASSVIIQAKGKQSNLQLLAEDDPTAKQVLKHFALARFLDYDSLISSSDKYIFVPMSKQNWFDWIVVEK